MRSPTTKSYKALKNTNWELSCSDSECVARKRLMLFVNLCYFLSHISKYIWIIFLTGNLYSFKSAYFHNIVISCPITHTQLIFLFFGGGGRERKKQMSWSSLWASLSHRLRCELINKYFTHLF